MPKVKIGINLFQDATLKELVRWWQEAEELGYAWIGIPDSPLMVHGHYVTLAAFAMVTKRVPFVSMVTNPVTRHVSTVAGEYFSLTEMAPGRVSLGIGSADSAAYGVGLKASSVEHLRKYVRALRALLRGEEVEWQGARFKGEWRYWTPPRDIKVYIAAAGPKMFRMAAEEGDGVIIGQYDRSKEGIAFINQMLEEGCKAAGKKLSDLDVWHHIHVHLGASRQEVKSKMFVHAQQMARFSMEGKMIPDQYKDAVRQVAATWKLAYHAGRGNVESTELAKRLGIFDWLVERTGPLMGNVEEIGEGVRWLADQGITNVIFLPRGRDKLSEARALAPLVKRFA